MEQFNSEALEVATQVPFAHGLVLAHGLSGRPDQARAALQQLSEHVTDLGRTDAFQVASGFDFAAGTLVLSVLTGDVDKAMSALDYQIGGADEPKTKPAAAKRKASTATKRKPAVSEAKPVEEPVADESEQTEESTKAKPVEQEPVEAEQPAPVTNDLPWRTDESNYSPFADF